MTPFLSPFHLASVLPFQNGSPLSFHFMCNNASCIKSLQVDGNVIRPLRRPYITVFAPSSLLSFHFPLLSSLALSPRHRAKSLSPHNHHITRPLIKGQPPICAYIFGYETAIIYTCHKSTATLDHACKWRISSVTLLCFPLRSTDLEGDPGCRRCISTSTHQLPGIYKRSVYFGAILISRKNALFSIMSCNCRIVTLEAADKWV